MIFCGFGSMRGSLVCFGRFVVGELCGFCWILFDLWGDVFNGWSVGMLDMRSWFVANKAIFCFGNFVSFYYRCTLYPVTKPLEE